MEDMEAWRYHPNVDIIENRSNFSSKISRLNDLVVKRIGIDVGNSWTQEIFLNQTIGKFMSVFSLDFSRILKKSSLLCLEFILALDFQVCHDNSY
jgi:hypothetical protein